MVRIAIRARWIGFENIHKLVAYQWYYLTELLRVFYTPLRVQTDASAVDADAFYVAIQANEDRGNA